MNVSTPSATTLLQADHLTISAEGAGPTVHLVDDISITIKERQVVALVGESGCGKSLTALSILRLLPKPSVRVTAGKIIWKGSEATKQQGKEAGTKARRHEGTKGIEEGNGTVDLLQLSEKEIRAVRGREIAMIFQEPMTALNPVFSVGQQIAEVLMLHRGMGKKEAWGKAARMLDQVGITDSSRCVESYPHQLSGGMRQRVLIALALAGGPRLLIADEPTTALDVTIQAQILDLLRHLQSETGMSILLITHDLGVVAQMTDYVYVMYAGLIVEHAPVESLLTRPMHPYTEGLLRCTPQLDDAGPLQPIPGGVPDPADLPRGCRFHPRCRQSRLAAAHAPERAWILLKDSDAVLRRCVEEFDSEPSGTPVLREAMPGHFVACWEA